MTSSLLALSLRPGGHGHTLARRWSPDVAHEIGVEIASLELAVDNPTKVA
jgi:hypothetical protein